MLEKRAQLGQVQLELLAPGDRVKTAGAMPEVQRVLDAIKPHPAYTYALVNAMGYSEFYGTNSNADWYGYCPELDFNGLLHAWPDIGEDLETDRMKGKDWPYGYPCFYGAAVYAHHKNTCPTQLGFGDVQFVYANPVMKRVELLMRIFNEEARKKGHLNIVERIQARERCDVSMGARIPWDACSICTDWDAVKRAWATYNPIRHRHPGIAVLEAHKRKPIRGIAVVAADYCEHIRRERNRVLPDGRRAYMYNIFPRFFDISCVFIGADRTARVMWHKTAPYREDAPIPQPMRSAQFGLQDMLDKTAEKRAELVKEIPDGFIEKVLTDSDTAPEVRFDLTHKDPRKVLSAAASLGMLLSPPEFHRLLGGDGSGFSTSSSQVDEHLGVHPRHVDEELLSALMFLAPERSAYKPFVEPRITRVSPQIADVSKGSAPSADRLAALYNGYRLSVLEHGEGLADRARGRLVADPFELESGAVQLGALLLGLAPVVHLLAAHLRRQSIEGQHLRAMAAILADTPTFSTLAKLGASIRIAMTVETQGLLPALLRLLDTKA